MAKKKDEEKSFMEDMRKRARPAKRTAEKLSSAWETVKNRPSSALNSSRGTASTASNRSISLGRQNLNKQASGNKALVAQSPKDFGQAVVDTIEPKRNPMFERQQQEATNLVGSINQDYNPNVSLGQKPAFTDESLPGLNLPQTQASSPTQQPRDNSQNMNALGNLIARQNAGIDQSIAQGGPFNENEVGDSPFIAMINNENRAKNKTYDSLVAQGVKPEVAMEQAEREIQANRSIGDFLAAKKMASLRNNTLNNKYKADENERKDKKTDADIENILSLIGSREDSTNIANKKLNLERIMFEKESELTEQELAIKKMLGLGQLDAKNQSNQIAADRLNAELPVLAAQAKASKAEARSRVPAQQKLENDILKTFTEALMKAKQEEIKLNPGEGLDTAQTATDVMDALNLLKSGY